MNLKNFKKATDWIKVWSGRWSLTFDSQLEYTWTKEKSVAGKAPFGKVIYFYTDGITDCWVSQTDKDDLGKRLIGLARKNPNYYINLSRSHKILADEITLFIKSHNSKTLSFNEFRKFWKLAGDYYHPFLSIKYIADYLSAEEYKRSFLTLESARKYGEPIYRNVENFWEDCATQIAASANYNQRMILSAAKDEVALYFKNKILPDRKLLANRYKRSALVADASGYRVFVKKEVKEIEKIIFFKKTEDDILKGQIAYGGMITGRVKVVLNPKNASDFKKGDILVTGMTRPDYLPFMKKAAAFVTDAGGILSHAAIIAREMNKPCVIGTKIATKVLHDGDLVEVDANKGIVKILRKK